MLTIEEDTLGALVIMNRNAFMSGPYDSAQAAKKADLHAIRVYGDHERVFDARKPLHQALAKIEARHNLFNEIVAVGKTSYLIRRNRFAVEVPIKYTVRENMVSARNDMEVL